MSDVLAVVTATVRSDRTEVDVLLADGEDGPALLGRAVAAIQRAWPDGSIFEVDEDLAGVEVDPEWWADLEDEDGLGATA